MAAPSGGTGEVGVGAAEQGGDAEHDGGGGDEGGDVTGGDDLAEAALAVTRDGVRSAARHSSWPRSSCSSARPLPHRSLAGTGATSR